MFGKIRQNRNAASRRAAAMTIVEMVVAVAVFAVASAAFATLFSFSIMSSASMVNYATLDQENRQAMDKLTREIREAWYVSGSASNSLTLLNGLNQTVVYQFNSGNHTMTRKVDSGAPQMLLTNCLILNFNLYQRNPSNNNLEIYPVGSTNTFQNAVKAVELTWKTQKKLNPSSRINSENVQTARIVIRKESSN
jgi:Tfp pilus assembly protein PilW